MSDTAEKIISGDIRALARAASWIEERRPEAEALLRELFPRTGRAMILGVTGAPGAGKSTLSDQIVRTLRDEGKTVGVIAVDPSSPYTGGAILGDRIRMQRHHADQGVFIRSMATRGWLGGLARATMEMTMLFDAAGRDVVIVETVGVGQDEVEIARLAGVTMVVLVPGMGDDVQAIKAGIIEIADVFVINKSDVPGAEKLERELNNYLGLSHRPDGWTPRSSAPRRPTEKESRKFWKQPRIPGAKRWEIPHGGNLEPQAPARCCGIVCSDRLPEEELLAAGRDVAEKRRDPYSILNDWLKRL